MSIERKPIPDVFFGALDKLPRSLEFYLDQPIRTPEDMRSIAKLAHRCFSDIRNKAGERQMGPVFTMLQIVKNLKNGARGRTADLPQAFFRFAAREVIIDLFEQGVLLDKYGNSVGTEPTRKTELRINGAKPKQIRRYYIFLGKKAFGPQAVLKND